MRVSSGSSGSGASSGWGARSGEDATGGLRSNSPGRVADDVDRARQCLAIDHDLDQIAVAEPADRASGQRFGRDVTDTRAG